MPIVMLVMTSPRKLNVKARSFSHTLSLSTYLPSILCGTTRFVNESTPVNSSRAQECRTPFSN
jgi:hypothetical protein